MDKKSKKAFKSFMELYGGNQSLAADGLGYTQARLSQVATGVKDISDSMAARIHAVTGGEISMFDLSENLRKLQKENGYND